MVGNVPPISYTHPHYSDADLRLAFVLNTSLAILEIVGGLWTNSVAILSDAVHDLGDSLALGAAWSLDKYSQKVSDRQILIRVSSVFPAWRLDEHSRVGSGIDHRSDRSGPQIIQTGAAECHQNASLRVGWSGRQQRCRVATSGTQVTQHPNCLLASHRRRAGMDCRPHHQRHVDVRRPSRAQPNSLSCDHDLRSVQRHTTFEADVSRLSASGPRRHWTWPELEQRLSALEHVLSAHHTHVWSMDGAKPRSDHSCGRRQPDRPGCTSPGSS